MAAPNIVNVTSIYGKTVQEDDISNSVTEFLENAASSNKVLKINSLIVANIDGTNAADITVSITTASSTTALGYLAKTISIPADATLVVISKDTSIYLEEDRAICLEASATGDLSAICSYEELDDA